jgi:hypothetical protein
MSQEIWNKEYKFDNLYGLDKSNKIKEWTIKVVDMNSHSLIIYTYGYLTGEKTECKITINNGKNKGEKNETTQYVQAILDAKSKWNKKKDVDNYVTDLEKLKQNLKNEIT